jgi:phytanoyl-CoA hydroxylase
MIQAAKNWYDTKGPNGVAIRVPLDVDVAMDPYLGLSSDEAIKNYYLENGYVVLRNLVPPALCDRAGAAFGREVKNYDGPLYRQTTSGNPEKHRLTKHGYVENSILNVHDLPTSRFKEFRNDSLEILAHSKIQGALKALFAEPGQLVQSMYFEGNPSTWPHQDTYYLDSEQLGSMVAAWVAVEDIKPGAGRFYVYPGSHKIDLKKNGGDFDIAFHHERYKHLIIDVINNHGLELSAPALKKGDVLFWNAKTIHGSLSTTQDEFSRCSFTAHYIPESHRFIQFQSRIKSFQSRMVNGMRVNYPKDQDRIRNRVIFGLETTFPRAFRTIKNTAIKVVTS